MFSVFETGGLEEQIRVFPTEVEPATYWPQLFKRLTAISAGEITIQWISVRETNCAIQWIKIYLVDSAIHRLNNWDLALAVQRLKSLIQVG